MTQTCFLYAPNVHTGGGLVLLKSLLTALACRPNLVLFLDARNRASVSLPSRCEVIWVSPQISSRLAGEQRLARMVNAGDKVLCFHGLPPLLPNRGEVIVFLQNKLYLERSAFNQNSSRVRVRVGIERMLCRALRRRVDRYVVQTDSMAEALRDWWAGTSRERTKKPDVPSLSIIPFNQGFGDSIAEQQPGTDWDFLYVADGVAHKNHLRLLEAWAILARDSITPSLALTLPERDFELIEAVDRLRKQGVRIFNLGNLPHEELFALYQKSGALIFPSLMESFGLPLIEASTLGIPILASEMDYVYDVCCPQITFDPYSARSIARAVMRFSGVSRPHHEIVSPEVFLKKVFDAN